MRIFVPRERQEEKRVAISPETTQKFKKLGIDVAIESGIGKASFYSDEAYKMAGAEIVSEANVSQYLSQADIILHVLPSEVQQLELLKPNAWHISFFDPFRYEDRKSVCEQRSLNVVSLERIPRTSLAQKMDALSSQSSLAGYVSVLEGAHYLSRALPMMVTSAGTLQAVRVFVIGAGVAGLQAIATAKRLGARVEAFDTRPEVEEQVHSLGAKFLKIKLGETQSSAQGYAKALSDEQLELQRKMMLDTCAHTDILITTAKVFGRKAPLIVNESLVKAMKPGSVIVDLAVEAGGNTEGLVAGKNIQTEDGVYILGEGYWERHVATSASQMYASNLYAFIEHFWNATTQSLKQNLEDPILKSCLWMHQGKVLF